MSKRQVPKKPRPLWAKAFTSVATAMWGMIFILTLIAYARADLKPVSLYPPGFVKGYVLVMMTAMAAAWLLTPQPNSSELMVDVFRFFRSIVLVIVAAAAVGAVFDLGPSQHPEAATLMNVIDSLVAGAVGIGMPFVINMTSFSPSGKPPA